MGGMVMGPMAVSRNPFFLTVRVRAAALGGTWVTVMGYAFPRTVPMAVAVVPASEVTVVREGPLPSARGFPFGSLNSRVKLRVLSGLPGFPGLTAPPSRGGLIVIHGEYSCKV